MPTFPWPFLLNGPASTSSDSHGCYHGCHRLPPLLLTWLLTTLAKGGNGAAVNCVVFVVK